MYAARYILQATMLAVWWRGGRRTPSPTHQNANTDACKTYHTAYTAVSLRMNRQGSKHVAENTN